MKSKIFAILLSCIFISSCAIVSTACVKKHEHNYQWIDNGLGAHYQQCFVLDCTEPVVNTGIHSYTNGVCICGNKQQQGGILPSHTHNYQWVDSGLGKHYQQCCVLGCLEPVTNMGDHSYVNGVCVCGNINSQGETPSHKHNYNWIDNGDGTHKQHCTNEGCSAPDKNSGQHDFTNGNCVCGKEKPEHVHNYKWVDNGDGTHKQHCSNEDCPASEIENGQHDFTNGNCVCGKEKPQPTKGLEYVLNSDNESYSVKGIGSATDKNIIIPDNYNGKPVTAIESYAFNRDSSITSLIIPDSVVSVGYDSFFRCSELISVIIGNGVTCIENAAFYECTNLAYLTIGNSVAILEDYAFRGCSGLKSITIPNSLTDIRFEAFMGCSGLESITVESGNTKYHSSGNCLIETLGKTLITGCKNSVIPNDGSVKIIGGYAFYDNSNLISITVPSSIKEIGKWSFYGCCNLESITVESGNTNYYSTGNCLIETATKTLIVGCNNSVIPADGSVEIIGPCAFYKCCKIKSIVIPDSVKSIGNSAFKNCTGMVEIIIPDGVTDIGEYAFNGCAELAAVSLPDSLINIGEWAFAYCSKLKNITIQNGVTIIDEYTFYSCNSLESVILPDSVITIGDDAFSECISLTNITLGNCLKSIDRYAFNSCISLKSITVPDTLSNIGEYVFYRCSDFTSIIFSGTKQQWNAITKHADWSKNLNGLTVNCSDGKININS